MVCDLAALYPGHPCVDEKNVPGPSPVTRTFSPFLVVVNEVSPIWVTTALPSEGSYTRNVTSSAWS